MKSKSIDTLFNEFKTNNYSNSKFLGILKTKRKKLIKKKEKYKECIQGVDKEIDRLNEILAANYASPVSTPKNRIKIAPQILSVLNSGPLTSVQIVQKIHLDFEFEYSTDKANKTQYKTILRNLSRMKKQNIVNFSYLKVSDKTYKEKLWSLNK